ncbi:MAG: hypothetical protein DMF97_19740 [Acidobacteria bacterium]|nr:MAG: hypothetical protein DMF97_19740 [Acidobacteriota bacterium]
MLLTRRDFVKHATVASAPRVQPTDAEVERKGREGR